MKKTLFLAFTLRIEYFRIIYEANQYHFYSTQVCHSHCNQSRSPLIVLETRNNEFQLAP